MNQAAGGKDQNVFRIYKVEQANGQWLWLVAEGSGVKGWAPAANVSLFDQAIDYITNQIRANPGARSKYLWRANVWEARKELEIAIADYNEAIRLDPGYALAYNNRGNAWNAKKDYDKAIADYNEAIRLDPGDAPAYYNRGGAWHDKKDYDKAIADYNEAIRLDPGIALAYIGRGNAWMAKKDYDKAIADYNEAVRIDPKYAYAYNGRGNAWRDKKDYDKAIADYSEAIRIDPKYAYAYNGRGLAWSDKKDYDKAIADYSEAIRLDPGYALTYFNRGASFLLTGSEKAGDDERKFLELEGWRGEYSQYAVLLGHCGSRRAGKAEAATGFLDDAAARCDTAAWPYSVIRYLRGEIDPKALLAAATDTDKMTEARCYLGLDLAKKGKTAEAREHFLWVKKHGNPTFSAYTIALAELDRLEKANQHRAK